MLNLSPYKTVKEWTKPYSDCPVHRVRPKTYSIIELPGGKLAFRKQDSCTRLLRHEAAILRRLAPLKCVPTVLFEEQDAIVQKYIPGQLLSEVLTSLGRFSRIVIVMQMVAILCKVHCRSVVHGDVRLWNFIVSDYRRIVLFDFEYAYSLKKLGAIEQLPDEVVQHYQGRLMTRLQEWIECCEAIKTLLSSDWLLLPFYGFAYASREILLRVHWRRRVIA